MKDVAVIIAGAIIMLASSVCLLAGGIAANSATSRFYEVCAILAWAHFFVGLFVIFFGAITVRNKPKT